MAVAKEDMKLVGVREEDGVGQKHMIHCGDP